MPPFTCRRCSRSSRLLQRKSSLLSLETFLLREIGLDTNLLTAFSAATVVFPSMVLQLPVHCARTVSVSKSTLAKAFNEKPPSIHARTASDGCNHRIAGWWPHRNRRSCWLSVSADSAVSRKFGSSTRVSSGPNLTLAVSRSRSQFSKRLSRAQSFNRHLRWNMWSLHSNARTVRRATLPIRGVLQSRCDRRCRTSGLSCTWSS